MSRLRIGLLIGVIGMVLGVVMSTANATQRNHTGIRGCSYSYAGNP